jgi:DNA-directed RNA polymerase specialized sigma24 family protein
MAATEYALGRGAVFEPLCQRLFALAYRMTGTRADAEDIVQAGSSKSSRRPRERETRRLISYEGESHGAEN